jgi:hypothetical protein
MPLGAKRHVSAPYRCQPPASIAFVHAGLDSRLPKPVKGMILASKLPEIWRMSAETCPKSEQRSKRKALGPGRKSQEIYRDGDAECCHW